MKKIIAWTLIFLLFFNPFLYEAIGCLRTEVINLEKKSASLEEKIKELKNDIAENTEKIREASLLIEKNQTRNGRIYADKEMLKSSGNVVVRMISTFLMHLTFLRNLPPAASILVGEMIKSLLNKINELTLQLNVFKREIKRLEGEFNRLEKIIDNLEFKKWQLDLQNKKLKEIIAMKKQELKRIKTLLREKKKEKERVEKEIQDYNAKVKQYNRTINMLEKEIAARSKEQQGSIVPKGMSALLNQLATQRELLAYARKRLVELNIEHGC